MRFPKLPDTFVELFVNPRQLRGEDHPVGALRSAALEDGNQGKTLCGRSGQDRPCGPKRPIRATVRTAEPRSTSMPHGKRLRRKQSRHIEATILHRSTSRSVLRARLLNISMRIGSTHGSRSAASPASFAVWRSENPNRTTTLAPPAQHSHAVHWPD